jgi:diadenosine tetraphosphate (Ap4A) HIT family hydrolase
MDCPFCDIARARLVAESRLAVGVADVFPVNPGHALVK